jgi:tetratricopeptide (TPR) repeat protein
MAIIDQARAALAGVQADPAGCRRAAEQVLATPGCPPEAAVVATWACGRAHQELGDLDRACQLLTAAADGARDLGDAATEARVEMSRAWALMAAGDTTEALAALAVAEAGLTGADHARVVMQRGLLDFQLGRLEDAVRAFDRAEPALRRADDHVAEARLLVNRAAASTALGRVRPAEADLVRAIDVATAAGQDLIVAGAEHNLGFLHGRRGDVPRALRHFDRAGAAYARLDNPGRLTSVLAVDRGEVLLSAGLVEEARAEAAAAVAGFRRAGDAANAHEALLQAATVELAAGRADAARAFAVEAEEGFRSSARHAWAALAAYTALRAEVAATEHQDRPPAALLGRARRIADRLAAQGWPVEAAHARTFVARMALARGRTDLAREVLATSRITGRAAPALRVQAWHGRALLRLAEGDRAGARRAARRGLAVVEAHRDGLGATELRANASALGADLARLGVRLALEQGRPAAVLAATEAHRAGALHLPTARPAADPRLADAMSALRAAEADHRATVLEGRADGSSAPAVIEAERRVRDLSRLSHGAGATDHHRLTLGSLRDALQDRVLVSFTALDGSLHAVVVEPGRARLLSLGAAATVETERQHLTSALRRGLHTSLRAPDRDPSGSGTGGDRVVTAIDAACSRLDDLLLAPLGLPVGAEVVVVPTGSGHGIPWGSLPSLRGRAVTVAPAAALWARPRRPRRPAGPLVVAGPDLVGAEPEVRAIAAMWPTTRVLTGPEATVAAVLDAFATTDLVHVAAHGTFRADSPLFSSLRLGDGSLTVYDLERLDRAPATVVLPACSAGAVDVRAGDELLGTTAALLGIGVVSVIAPVVAVPDLATARFSTELHRHLAAGAGPARACAEAGARLRADGDALSTLVATSFVCFGADDRPGRDRREATGPRPPGRVRRRRSTDDPRGGDRA